MKKTGFLWIVLIIIGIYYFFNPENTAFFPKCPLKTMTGIDCPGCGSQRAVHELLHFNLKKAVQYNALLVFAVPYFLAGFAFSFTGLKLRFPKTRNFLFGKKAIYTVLVIIILFFIFRNI